MAEEHSNIGQQIGGSYRIVAELGRGGFGDVYKGQHIVFANRPPVAIKLLHAFLRSPKERDQFLQEAQLLNTLTHPHILPILDAGLHEGLPYIVMEYASRGSLQDRLDQQPGQPFPLEEAITLLTQIGEALHYAHQQHIVHRDLKPDNILFNAKGEALLADFGLAAILSSAHTRDMGSGGTPAYMAPEMFEGKVSVKSDQYALGCMAYELVTGHKPFDVENMFVEAVWYQHAKVDPVVPTQHNPRLPAYIEKAILTAMAKDRTDRHADVHTFLTTLQSSEKSPAQWHEESTKRYIPKRYEETLSPSEQVLRITPNDALVYFNKGKALSDLKRYEEALAAFEQAIRLNPNDADVYNGKGITLERIGKNKEAQQAFKRARQLGYSN